MPQPLGISCSSMVLRAPSVNPTPRCDAIRDGDSVSRIAELGTRINGSVSISNLLDSTSEFLNFAISLPKRKRRTLRKVELNSWPAALRFAIALTAKLVDELF
jgi:hypothetical protein